MVNKLLFHVLHDSTCLQTKQHASSFLLIISAVFVCMLRLIFFSPLSSSLTLLPPFLLATTLKQKNDNDRNQKGANPNAGGRSSAGKPGGNNFVNLLDENDDENEIDKDDEAEEEEEEDQEISRSRSLGSRKWNTGNGSGGRGGGSGGGDSGFRNRNGAGRYGIDHNNESEDDDLLL